MGCFTLEYHGGGGFHPSSKSSGPIASMKVKFYMHIVKKLHSSTYFQTFRLHIKETWGGGEEFIPPPMISRVIKGLIIKFTKFGHRLNGYNGL